jgi:ATP-dependent DNA helicase RecG
MYREKGDKLAYTRQAGFSPLQHQGMVLNYVRQHRRIQRNEVMDLCHLSGNQAHKLLKRLTAEGRLKLHGEKRGAFYTLGEGEQV